MNCSTDKTSELHSVVFKTNQQNTWTTTKARAWLKKEGIKPIKHVDKTINSLRYRIVDPECFVSFSTKVVKTDMGIINLVIGWYPISKIDSSSKPVKKKVGFASRPSLFNPNILSEDFQKKVRGGRKSKVSKK